MRSEQVLKTSGDLERPLLAFIQDSANISESLFNSERLAYEPLTPISIVSFTEASATDPLATRTLSCGLIFLIAAS